MNDISETRLEDLTYMGIGVFFVNLCTAGYDFVYEKLEDGSLQVYTTLHRDELTKDNKKLRDLFLKEREWRVYESVEVFTIHVAIESGIEYIVKNHPHQLIAKGL